MIVPLSIPSPPADWRVFEVGQWIRDLGVGWFPLISVHAYALCILAGIVAAVLLTGRRLKDRGADPGLVLDVALPAVLLGIAGGRIFHVLTHPDDYFYPGADPWAVVRVWEGGLAIFGALLLGAVGVWIGCRSTGLRFWTFADALAPGLLLAQALGRLGNYFNEELFGLPTDLPWGLVVDPANPAYPLGLPEGTLFHPTFLYEILWNLLGVAVLLLVERRRVPRSSLEDARPGRGGATTGWRLQWGRLLGLYLVWYGLGRSLFESIRIDPSELVLGIRINMLVALAAVVIGLVIIVVQGRRHPGLEPSPYRPGRAPGEAVVESEDPDVDGDEDPAIAYAGTAQSTTARSTTAQTSTTPSGAAPARAATSDPDAKA